MRLFLPYIAWSAISLGVNTVFRIILMAEITKADVLNEAKGRIEFLCMDVLFYGCY